MAVICPSVRHLVRSKIPQQAIMKFGIESNGSNWMTCVTAGPFAERNYLVQRLSLTNTLIHVVHPFLADESYHLRTANLYGLNITISKA